jgi:hypothetical protein
MVLRLISSSPRGPGFVAPVAGVMRSIIASLTPASGRQDHTTSPSARVRSRQQRTSRPSHPAPNVRDDRETPLVRGRDRDRYAGDLGEKNTRIFLREGLDRRVGDLPVGAIGAYVGPVATLVGHMSFAKYGDQREIRIRM